MVYTLARIAWLAWCWLELIAFTAVLYLLSFIPRRRAALGAWYFALFRRWCRFFVRALGVDLRLHQQNARPLPRQFLLIANHPSAFEDVGVPALFPVYSLAKIEVRDWWWVGRINEAAGTLFVQRESSASRRAAADEIVAALARGHSVALYPEGGCKGRRVFSSFRYGAFDISLRTGVPIVPVFLHYEAQERFEWAGGQTLLHKLWHFMTAPNNRANYYVFDAIEPSRFPTKEAYYEYVYARYLAWQAKYLE